MKLKAQFICSYSAAGNIYSETNRLSISQLNCRYAATALSNRPDELHTLYSKQQCIGDDTKDAGRRSPNCIRKTKNTFCRTWVCPILPASPRKISLKSVISCRVMAKNDFQYSGCPPSWIYWYYCDLARRQSQQLDIQATVHCTVLHLTKNKLFIVVFESLISEEYSFMSCRRLGCFVFSLSEHVGATTNQQWPLTKSMMSLLRTGLVLTVQRYSPWSSRRTSRICRFHSLTSGLMRLNRESSMTRRSSYVNGNDFWSSHAT